MSNRLYNSCASGGLSKVCNRLLSQKDIKKLIIKSCLLFSSAKKTFVFYGEEKKRYEKDRKKEEKGEIKFPSSSKAKINRLIMTVLKKQWKNKNEGGD